MSGARRLVIRKVPTTFVSHRRLYSASVRSAVVTCGKSARVRQLR